MFFYLTEWNAIVGRSHCQGSKITFVSQVSTYLTNFILYRWVEFVENSGEFI